MKKNRLVYGLLLVVSIFLVACNSSSSDGDLSSSQASNGDSASSDYPKQTIEIIVPFAAGGTTDIASRAVASVLPEYLPNNVTVNVVNKEGGGGVIGMSEIYNRKNDGYSIAMATIGPLTLQPHSTETVYEATSFAPIAQVVGTPNVMIVSKNSDIKTYEEFEQFVKENPGKFKYGMSGAGLTQHITMEGWSLESGYTLAPIPFEGGAPAIAAMLGGHINGALVQTTEAMPHIESGEAVPIFNSGTYKTAGLEDVPLLSEKGTNVGQDVWTGLVAPKDTPAEIIAILEEAVKKSLEDSRVIEQFNNLGIPPGFLSSADFEQVIIETNERNKKVIEQLNLKK